MLVVDMFLYLSCVLVGMILITLFNVLYNPFSVGLVEVSILVVCFTVLEIIIDLIMAFFVRWVLPKKFFNVDKKWFSASKKEQRFYEYLGVKKWKDKTLELGALTNFRKNKIVNPKENDYIERFIIESNYGVLVHLSCVIFGFLIVFHLLF